MSCLLKSHDPSFDPVFAKVGVFGGKWSSQRLRLRTEPEYGRRQRITRHLKIVVWVAGAETFHTALVAARDFSPAGRMVGLI